MTRSCRVDAEGQGDGNRVFAESLLVLLAGAAPGEVVFRKLELYSSARTAGYFGDDPVFA